MSEEDAADAAGGMRREVLRLAVPAFLALVAEPLFLLADSAIVGHLGVPQLAGLGVASSVLLTAAGVFVFLAYGTTSVVARLLGSGDQRGALAAGIDGMWLGLLLGALAAAVVALVAEPLCRLVGGGSPEVTEQAVTYLRVSALGLPSMLLVLGATGVLRGLQDTRTPLVVSVAGFSLNIVLNLVLVYGAGLGIAGSALGTVLAQTAMAVAFVTTVVRKALPLGAPLAPHPAGVLRAAVGGSPLLVRTLALRGVILVTTAVTARYGAATLAAGQVVMTVWTFLAFSLDALAIAAQSITGKALGAGDVTSAREAAQTVTRWGVLGGVVTGALLLPLSPFIGRMFSPDPEVVSAAAWGFVVVAMAQWLSGYVFVLDGVLMGAGDMVWLAAAMVLAAAVWVPVVLLLSRDGALLPLSFGVPLVGVWVWFGGGFMLLRALGLWWRSRTEAWLVTGASR